MKGAQVLAGRRIFRPDHPGPFHPSSIIGFATDAKNLANYYYQRAFMESI
jgi:hypothetical protein